MKSDRAWVGLDMGMDNSFLCAIDGDGIELLKKPVPTESLAIREALGVLADYVVEEIAVEAGATGIHVIRELVEQGFPITLYEAQRLSKFLRVRPNKTDANDAAGLAEIARFGWAGNNPVHLKSIEMQNLRSKIGIRHKVVVQRLAFEGILRSLLRMHGGTFKTCYSDKRFEERVLSELSRMRDEKGQDLRSEVIPLLNICLQLRRYQREILKGIEDWVASSPVCSMFTEIPGVGPLCALSFYTAIEDPARFAKAEKVGAYLGLTPEVSQSGKSLRHGRISKRGSRLTRTHLVQAGGVLLLSKKPSALREWGLAVKERRGWNRARVALAKKLAITMLAIWKSGQPFSDRSLGARALGSAAETDQTISTALSGDSRDG
jgi:transposase